MIVSFIKLPEVGIFILKSANHKLLRSFRCRKSANFLCQSANRKSANFMINPQITNSQITNPQISTKYCTIVSQNSSKSRLCKRFMSKFELEHYCYICKEKKYVQYLRTCGGFKSANPKKIGSANGKSAKSHICGRSANIKKLFKCANLQICDLQNLFADHPPLQIALWIL
jgi:hypothetical protein